jgi:transcription elongation factor SPT5
MDHGNDRTSSETSFHDGGARKNRQRKSTQLDSSQMEDVEVELAQHVKLPSIMDSKIWKVRCINGCERSLTAQLLKKAIDFLNQERPFMILSVFNCDKTPGCIYIEAFNKSHVLTIVDGISGILRRNQTEMIPYNSMPQILKLCQEMSKTTLKEHQWVRIKSGVYKDDLGLIEFIQGSKKACVRLIPRMRTENDTETGTSRLKLVTKYAKGDSKLISIP